MSNYKVIYEGWHRHLNEAEPVAPETTTAPEVKPEEFDKIVAGVNSREYPDSLINFLKPDPKKPGLIPDEQLSQLLQLLLKATEEDDIVLEALGGPERDPRAFSPNTVRELNKLVASFRLDSKVQQKLEKTLNKWAKMNTVKFSAASTSPTAPGEENTEDEDTEPGVTTARPGTPTATAPEPGEENTEDEPTEPAHPPGAKDSEKWKEDTYLWADGTEFKPTPETAFQNVVESRDIPGMLKKGGKKQLSRTLKYSEEILKIAGGLAFKAFGAKNLIETPEWQQSPTHAGKISTPYDLKLIFPKTTMNRLRRPLRGDGAHGYAQPVGTVTPKAVENLKKYIALLKNAHETYEEPPEEPDVFNLQETLERWQTLAGINKRIL